MSSPISNRIGRSPTSFEQTSYPILEVHRLRRGCRFGGGEDILNRGGRHFWSTVPKMKIAEQFTSSTHFPIVTILAVQGSRQSYNGAEVFRSAR